VGFGCFGLIHGGGGGGDGEKDLGYDCWLYG
jgi:hypothetical protein